MKIGAICTRDVVVAPPKTTIIDEAKLMRETHVADVVAVDVQDGRKVPVGILTDRDIALSVVANNADHIQSLVMHDVMTDDLVTAREDEDLEIALTRMKEHGVRRLPVVDAAGALVGILTLDDILQHLAARPERAGSIGVPAAAARAAIPGL